LTPGSQIHLGTKVAGLFTLSDVPAGRDLLFFATGTGVGPYLSMIRTHLACASGPRLAVVHGARHSWDLGYRGELTSLARLCPNFFYLPVISRPAEELEPWPGAVGLVQDVWRSGAIEALWGNRPTPETTHVFLCGNPAMIDEMVQSLSRDGYVEHSRSHSGALHVERYW
jgi:ferredoxin--NADP+ reductase